MSIALIATRKLLSFLRETYPGLIILFVPASTTSELQPLDKGFNFPFKSMITRSACSWLSNVISRQLESGTEPNSVDVPKTKTALVGPFCGWLSSAVKEMKLQPETIRRSFIDSGIMIAWDSSSSIHFLWQAEAMELHSKGTLWDPPATAKRSKNGKVSRTQISVCGLDEVSIDFDDVPEDELKIIEVAESDITIMDTVDMTASSSSDPVDVQEVDEDQLPIEIADTIAKAAMRRSKRNLKAANSR